MYQISRVSSKIIQEYVNSPSLISNIENELDEELVKMILDSNPKVFMYLPKTWRKNLNIIQYLIQCYPSYYCHLENEIKENDQNVKSWLSSGIKIFSFISDDYKTVENALIQLKHDPEFISNAPKRIRKDKRIAIEVAKHHPFYFQFISKEWRDDYIISALALSRYGNNIEHISERLKKSRKINYIALKNLVYSIQCSHKKIQQDREMILNYKKYMKKYTL